MPCPVRLGAMERLVRAEMECPVKAVTVWPVRFVVPWLVSGSPVRRSIASIVKAQMASAGFPQLLVLQPLAQQRLLVLQESRVKLMQIVQKLVCVVFMELLRPLSLEWVSPEQVLSPLLVEERLRVCLDGPVDLSIISLPCIGRELMDAA